MKPSPSELERQATEILRKAGFNASGEKRGSVTAGQRAFEKRQVRCGFRGSSRKNRQV